MKVKPWKRVFGPPGWATLGGAREELLVRRGKRGDDLQFRVDRLKVGARLFELRACALGVFLSFTLLLALGCNPVPNSGNQPSTDGAASLKLELKPLNWHGRILQIRGQTSPGATVMINRERAIILADGRFEYLTPPLADGSYVFTITAHSERGKSETLKITVEVPQDLR